MHGVILVLAWLLVALSGAASIVGAWAWWYLRQARGFWLLVRASQVAAVALAAAAGVAAALGRRPDGLFWVYALVPVGVGFVAEQLRILSAQSVLDARGLEGAAAVGRLGEADQRSVVLAILRREVGVMTLAAAVTVFLAVRAVATAAGL